MTKAYDDPNATVRRELAASTLAPASTAVFATFLLFQKQRIKACHSAVVTAGTTSVAGFAVCVGTDTLASRVIGTDTAGTIYHDIVASGGYVAPANTILTIKGLGTDAVGKVSITLESEVVYDAAQT